MSLLLTYFMSQNKRSSFLQFIFCGHKTCKKIYRLPMQYAVYFGIFQCDATRIVLIRAWDI
jgi:hypothetical protein